MVEVTTVEQLVDRLKKGKYKQSTEILAESKFRPYAYHVSLLNLFSVAKAAGDDDDTRRAGVPDQANLKVLELAYRRIDLEDAVSACVRAMECAGRVGWGKYVVTAPTIFARDEGTLAALNSGDEDAVATEVERAVPGCAAR